MTTSLRIAFLGNFQVDYSSESHHAKSLEALGHEVIRFQEPKVRASELYETECDLFVWVHTHGWETPGIEEVLDVYNFRGVPCITYHLDLYMPLKRWQRYQGHPYFTQMDHWFTVDPGMAAWITDNTEAEGHYIQAGVFGEECYMANSSGYTHDVIFVGSRGYHPEWPWRPKLIDWLKKTYGDRFTHVGGDGQISTTRGHGLNQLYADTKVVVGDSLCPGYKYYGYWSDRVYETLGRGGFLIHPQVPGMEQHFTGGRDLAFYNFGDLDGLKRTIDIYLSDDDARESTRHQGHEHVKDNHTYTHRWAEILETVFHD